MALEYVPLSDIKEYLRVNHDLHDDLLLSLIQAASAAVKNYMKGFSVYECYRDDEDNPLLDSNYEPVVMVDSNGDKELLFEVMQAVKMCVAIWYRNPDGTGGNSGHGKLPDSVTALLYSKRDPALA